MTYTAIYNTESIKGIQYSFCAGCDATAIDYIERKFSTFPNITLVENIDKNGKANEGRVVFVNGTTII